MKLRPQLRCAAALVILFGWVIPAVAQYPYPGRPAPRPTRVAILQYMSGEVSWAQCDTDNWAAAAINQRFTPNTCVWADKNSRAELGTGSAFLRMNSETSITVATLNPSTVQFKVQQGAISLTVPRLRPGEIYEIDTPNATLTVTKSGVYRVDVFPKEDQTWVTVRKGALAATGTGKAVTINSGQQVRFHTENSLQHTAEKAPAPDGFDDWAKVRNDRLGAFKSPPFGVVVGYGPYGAVPPPAPYPPPY